jgi:adhesin/invasin
MTLEDEKGNKQNSGVVEITVQQDRKIELIVDNIVDADRSDHSHAASALADGEDGVVMDLLLTDSFGDSTDRNGNELVDDTMTPELYDSNDKKVTLTETPCTTETPCVFIAKRDEAAGTVTLSSTLPGTFRWKAKDDVYGDSNYVDVTFTGEVMEPLNALIYQINTKNPVNLIGKEDQHPTLNNTYRFLLWRDKNKDGVYQMSEQLTEEEMAKYDYQWEFTGQSTNGHTGAQANTRNEDLVLPVTNREAAQKFAANVEDGVQGYGIRVTYSQKY